MIKSIVRLNTEERAQLLALVNTGRAAAAMLLHARIVLTADVREDGRRWSDAEIAAALDTSESTVQRVGQAFVEWGLETAVSRKPPSGRPRRAQQTTGDGNPRPPPGVPRAAGAHG